MELQKIYVKTLCTEEMNKHEYKIIVILQPIRLRVIKYVEYIYYNFSIQAFCVEI